MSTKISLPNLGENIESGDVLSILVSEGETISADQDLIEIETDKATMPVPSPQAGKVLKVLVSEGDTINVGTPIVELDEAGEDPPAQEESQVEAPAAQAEVAPPPKEAKPKKPESEQIAEQLREEERELPEAAPRKETTATAPPTSDIAPPPETDVPAVVEPSQQFDVEGDQAADVNVPGDGHAAAAAGPAVRRLARQLGVDLRRVQPSGPSGRVTEDDVRAYVRSSNERAASEASRGVTPPGTPDSDGYGAVRREKMSRLRQTIARNMTASYTTIPQLTNFDDVDITDLERIRKDSMEDYKASGIKLTSMPFLIKAVASALRHHPVVNSSIDAETNEVVYKEYVNIGIAVDTEKGLIVPVLRDADRKNIPAIARELASMAEAARSGNFAIDDLRGGTFTISNLGAIGGTYSTPIINPPEVAILLAGRSRTLPQWIEGEFKPRMMLPLSLTYDHRVVDGAAAARFLNEVKKFLSNPGRLLLAP